MAIRVRGDLEGFACRFKQRFLLEQDLHSALVAFIGIINRLHGADGNLDDVCSPNQEKTLHSLLGKKIPRKNGRVLDDGNRYVAIPIKSIAPAVFVLFKVRKTSEKINDKRTLYFEEFMPIGLLDESQLCAFEVELSEMAKLTSCENLINSELKSLMLGQEIKSKRT
ncbi:hypothetical protein [Serratia nevei]|uniref:hypothetical protein n=1 Tax=Serratia nevei TaxID=2703794 RepID=UPI00254EB170|nr:hypothetical protein [Serratia nevei]MDK5165492.1 hypothetical protein [Serratia nevei]